MSDKELYTYFKDRRASFEETPGDLLWNKIEQRLNSPDTPSNKSGNVFFTGLAIVAVLAIGFVLLSQVRNDDDAPVSKENKANKTVPYKEIKANNTNIISKDTVQKTRKEKFQSKNPASKATTDKPETPYLKFQPIANNTDSLNTTVVKSKLDYKTQIMPGRIIVTGKGKFTEQEFEQLINEILKIHKQADGSLIIVKARGQETFRRKITQLPDPNPGIKIFSKTEILNDSNQTHNEPVYTSFLQVKDTATDYNQLKLTPLKDSIYSDTLKLQDGTKPLKSN